MEYIIFNDGHKIPVIGLGTYQQDTSTLMDILYAAVEAGYRLIDTAPIYSNQKIIGDFVKKFHVKRHDLFLTSKVWNDEHENVSSSLQRTLDELQTDYLDLFLIHWPAMKEGNFIKAWEGLIQLREKGLINSIGVSNFSTRQINLLKENTGVLPVINQVEVHLRHQQKELIGEMSQLGIIVQSWSPLWAGGFTDAETEALARIAYKHSKSTAQIILGWHIGNNLCSVPKTSRIDRLFENINTFNIEFSKDEELFLASLNRDMKIMEYPDDYI
ncbi:aldo/keto reductase [Photorhabdus heterorhabditis]|uniref:Aldo/keto reductase n=1 Tax=Photorhabdus heterorhabditis TaxID=880156 RepID=A0A5B0X0F3_9GAMM|nr:aldo/keto reductase [Photorhabdus heterorhabditis]KAA1192135.1 aldo/keto reductase [Photorhabdus heterorhabditis]